MSRRVLPVPRHPALMTADLVGRLHVDLCRVAAALCRPGSAR
jgi:hypothetical protein